MNETSGERNYFLKHYLLPSDLWAILCSVFGFSFILSRIVWVSPEVRDAFFTGFFMSLVPATILTFFLHGGFRAFLKIKNLEYRDAFLMNTLIVDNHVDLNVSDNDLKELFIVLETEAKRIGRRAARDSGIVLVASTLFAIRAGADMPNIIIILVGGFISVIILSLFMEIFAERFLENAIRECRQMLEERNIGIKGNKLVTLKGSFYYFAFLFGLMMVILLSFIPNPGISLLILVFAAFIMILVIIKMLFSSISAIFKEVEEFNENLSIREEKVKYFTGSSYKEAVDLSKNLTVSAGKVYDARAMEKKARIELEELDESKTQFILATEHHLRTPLTISKGYLDSFLDKKGGTLDEEGKSYLNKVKDAIARVTDLVNELLEISQMEVGKSILKMESVNIKDLIISIMNNSKPDMDAKQIKPVFSFSEGNDALSLNKEKITEALSNLISNAIKYNKIGGELKIIGKIITDDNKKSFYQLTVEDQGIGIKPENISKIFTQYFERGEEARKVYATGRGIGLVISKNIIKAHQGNIRAESEGEGKGSRFIIELPI
jgi:signal transduction histidine kinase